jgi:hypothetical protein
LPAIACPDSLDFYISAEEDSTGIKYDHYESPFHAIPLNTTDTLFWDDFETDLGWTISGGQWARGTPTGGGGAWGNPDPAGAYSGSNILGYNLSGDYANDIPEYHVTSPAIDCQAFDNLELRFQRWLGVESSAFDHACIKISTDGTSWTTAWENMLDITDSSWTEQAYDISAFAAGQDTVYVRFTMGPTDGAWVFCGWNIDDLAIVGYGCEAAGLTITTGSLPDWTVGQPYSQALDCINAIGDVVWIDRDGDLAGTGLSLSADGVISGTPISVGDISFVAQVTDQTPSMAEKGFTFYINPAVEITTTSLDSGFVAEEYSCQLECSGGTGSIIWTDLNDDLAGSGLALSETGLLSGVPVTAGEITFTALATDAAGSIDQQPLTLDIVSYICGDADRNQVVNVSDVVLLINFVFGDGPAPEPEPAGDVDCNGTVNVSDVVYLINFVFGTGDDPCDTDGDGVPDC